MENFQTKNVALAQTSQNQKTQEQPELKPAEQKPQSENAKLVQELKKLLRKIESLEKREKIHELLSTKQRKSSTKSALKRSNTPSF